MLHQFDNEVVNMSSSNQLPSQPTKYFDLENWGDVVGNNTNLDDNKSNSKNDISDKRNLSISSNDISSIENNNIALTDDNNTDDCVLNIKSQTSLLNKDIESINKNEIDIVDLLHPTNLTLIAKMNEIAISENYPSNAAFYFEGFDGLQNKNKLIEILKSNAFKTGTVLNVEKTNNINKSNPNFNVVLACIHFGKQKKSTMKERQFLPNYVQACNTIVQQAHTASSIKNRSRNATYVRAHRNKTNNEDKIKVNRSKTTKLGCTFQITIFFEQNTLKWYLKMRKRFKFFPELHQNHIWINPFDMNYSKNNIPKVVWQTIVSLIQSGTGIPNIQQYIKTTYKVNIEYQTIYNIRVTHINDLIDICSKNPSGSAVDRLIALFTNTSNVSCVYILHRYNSGFVTCRRNKKESYEQIITELDSYEQNECSGKSITNWRDSLKLSSSNDVLVAFAWSHDEELKKAEMYPEFLSVDVTFGVNRERRELLLVAGIDGRNKVFTAFRCFIPSKQEHAYTWIMNQAVTHLLTANTLQYNQCISCDQEVALNCSVDSSIGSLSNAFKFSKLRLDCYHFFNKVWIEKVVVKCKPSYAAKQKLEIVKTWISTWFKVIETEEELSISNKYLQAYLLTINTIIGEVSMEESTKLIQKIINKKTKLLHPYFKDVCTFDFIGDSIVESANFPIKNGPISVSNNMDLSNSAFTQLKSTEAKYKKEQISSAKQLNLSKTWTTSYTKQYLTDYAEGIACSNFDRRTSYIKRRIDKNQWLVTSKVICSTTYDSLIQNNSEKATKFIHVREVTMNSNMFMNCSCHYPLRWLMPCVHICCVIDEKHYYTPDLFHLRWWKHFNYMYKNTQPDNKNNSSIKDLEAALPYVRKNHFQITNGKYKGIPFSKSKFVVDDNSGYNMYVKLHDTVYDDLLNFNNKRMNNIPVLLGSRSYKDMNTTINIGSDTDSQIDQSIINIGDNNVNIESMGAGSQVESNLSQFRTEIDEHSDSFEDSSNNHCYNENNMSNFNSLNPMFQNLISSIKSKDQLEKAYDTIEKLTYEFTSEGMNKRKISNTETTFLGESNGSRRPEKRHRCHYEK